MAQVRTRYAPSPTGYLHMGGAWMAFFNWLHARNCGGQFILRVEDTDRTRSTQEYEDSIFEDFGWLGIAWDEGPDVGGPFGPYRQTERGGIYARYAQEMLDRGAAYPCYCTPDELEAERHYAVAAGRSHRYSGRCRDRSSAELTILEAAGVRPSLRLRVTGVHAPIVVDDLVRGRVVFEPEHLDDYIIVRSDGTPLYNFANVVDDHLMRITHVIRGSEHLSNTPKQFVMYRALGWTPPAVAHLPTILGADRKKLSKRHGDTAVREYRGQGYLPEAILNFFALMAWHPEAEREVYALEELIRGFRLEDVGRASPIFDLDKLTWLNGVYMRGLIEQDRDRVAELCARVLTREGLLAGEPTPEQRRYLARVIEVVGDRLKVGRDIVVYGDFFFRDPIYDSEAAARHLTRAAAPLLSEYADALTALDPFERGSIEIALREVCTRAGVDARALVHPARVALTGKTAGPGLFELIEVLGRERAVERLRRAAGGVMTIEQIKNFAQVDERLGTGGQPTEAQLREVAEAGYEVVVNLGLLDPRYCLPDEAGLVGSLGLEYHHIPVKFDAPTVEDFHRFLGLMDRCHTRKTFVHCAANYRVSSFVALYGQLRLGWTVEQADAHARRFWSLDEAWLGFIEACRKQLGLDG